MAIPVYLWLKDDGGADIKGSVDVKDRVGSIEVVAQEHNLYIPTDNNTGKLTGTRIHTPFLFTKEIDASSPYLYKAVTTGWVTNLSTCIKATFRRGLLKSTISTLRRSAAT